MRHYSPGDSPLLDVLAAAKRLKQKHPPFQHAYIDNYLVWKLLVKFYADYGGTWWQDSQLNILVPLNPITGVNPVWKMAREN